MRIGLVVIVVLASALGCGSTSRPNGAEIDAAPPGDACVGQQCRVVDCAKMNRPPTSVSGTVYAPNGTLPLYGATVYVPNLDPGPLPDGAVCQRCDPNLPGDPIARTVSDESGHFQLDNIPAGTDVPLIIQIGKWRRQVLIPSAQQCAETPLDGSLTHLPTNHHEGDMPRIALTTGSADALECLVQRLGVSNSEFTTDGGPGRVHLYAGVGGASLFGSHQPMAPQATLWSSIDKLKTYDMVMMSCEGSQEASVKPQNAMDNLKMFADLGGRVFLSHYQNVWIAGDTGDPTHAPAVWNKIGTWVDNYPTASLDLIDQVNNPKGSSFAAWMTAVGGSPSPGQIPIDGDSFRQTVNSIDPAKAEQWVYWDAGGAKYAQDFQFTTPNEAAKDARCGKVVFSDMHVAGESLSTGVFPSGCSTTPLSPQEKALAFMFFDIASCVQVIQ